MAKQPTASTTRARNTAAAKAKAEAAEASKAAEETKVNTTPAPTDETKVEQDVKVAEVETESVKAVGEPPAQVSESKEAEKPAEPETAPEEKKVETVEEADKILTGQTLAEAQQRQLDENTLVNPVAKSVAELAKGDKAFADKTVDLGNGVTLTAKTNHPAVNPEVRAESLEKFIQSKYGLAPEAYPESLNRTIRGFKQYHMNMNSRAPVSLEEAAKHQSSWFRIVAGALDSQLGESGMCFDVILYLANRHVDDLFNERLACRAFNLLSDVVRDQFNLYQTIILGAANPRTRSRYIKTQLNLDAVSKVIRSDNQRRNLLAFLSSID